MGSPPATSPAASLQQIHKRPSPAALLTQLEQLNPRQRCFELIHTPCLAQGRATHQGHLKHQLPLVHQAPARAPFRCLPWYHGHLPLNSWHVSSMPKKINFFFFFQNCQISLRTNPSWELTRRHSRGSNPCDSEPRCDRGCQRQSRHSLSVWCYQHQPCSGGIKTTKRFVYRSVPESDEHALAHFPESQPLLLSPFACVYPRGRGTASQAPGWRVPRQQGSQDGAVTAAAVRHSRILISQRELS